METAAQGIYETIVAEGDETQKPYLIARFRIADFLDDPDNVLSKWQRRGDLADPAGDAPYLDLLAIIGDGRLAQEARRGLFRRYRQRQAFDDALNITRLYLRALPDDEKDPVLRKTANDMLIYVVEHLMGEKKFKEVYDFYKNQHRHVVRYPRGRLLYLVGEALEGLYLYKQASVVYYRALALPLTDEEKIDLYDRRARVYLAMRDFASADRLLTYLREIYAKSEAIAEIYYLSGRLEEERENTGSALPYYRKALEAASASSRRPAYAEAYLRMLLKKQQYPEMERVLLENGSGAVELDSQSRRTLLLSLAEGFEKSGDTASAEKVYRALLSSTPEKTKSREKRRNPEGAAAVG